MADENANIRDEADYYYDMTPTAEEIDNVLVDLVAALKDVGEFDVVTRIKAINGQRAKFVLGEGGGGIANIPAQHYELIIGDGNDSAYGGSQDTQSTCGSLFAENLFLQDKDDTAIRTHYIYAKSGQGVNADTDRYIFGQKYLSQNNKIPDGNFVMVQTGGWMKAKSGGHLTLEKSGEIRVSNRSQLIIDTNTNKTGNYHDTRVSIERTIPIYDPNNSYYAFNGYWTNERVDQDTELVIHDARAHITNGAEVCIHGGYYSEGPNITNEYNTQVYIDCLHGAKQNTALYLHSGGQIIVEENAKFHCSKKFNFQAYGGTLCFNGGEGLSKPEFIINGYCRFYMNGQGAVKIDENTAAAPAAIFDADGRLFVNLYGGYEAYGLKSSKGTLKYLLQKANEEMQSSEWDGAVSPITFDKIEEEWDRVLKEEFGEVVLSSYFYVLNGFSNDTIELMKSMLNYYNEHKNASLTLDDLYMSSSLIKPDKYTEILNFDNSILLYLTESTLKDDDCNLFKTSKYYNKNFLQELRSKSINFDTYFTHFYEEVLLGDDFWIRTVYNFYKAAHPSFSYDLSDFTTPKFIGYLSKNQEGVEKIFNALTDGIDAYVKELTDNSLIFSFKEIPTSLEDEFKDANRYIGYYFDTTTRKLICTEKEFNLMRKNLKVVTAEKIGNNTIVTLSGSENGFSWIQVAPNEGKSTDIRILDGAQVEMNGDARITITSKDLPYYGAEENPIRYKAGLTLSFTKDAYDATKSYPSEELAEEIKEIHFTYEELKALKDLIVNPPTPPSPSTSGIAANTEMEVETFFIEGETGDAKEVEE